jgi:hypothetical protein
VSKIAVHHLNPGRPTNTFSKEKRHDIYAAQSSDSFTPENSETNDMSCVRKRYREQGFSRKTVGVL